MSEPRIELIELDQFVARFEVRQDGYTVQFAVEATGTVQQMFRLCLRNAAEQIGRERMKETFKAWGIT